MPLGLISMKRDFYRLYLFHHLIQILNLKLPH